MPINWVARLKLSRGDLFEVIDMQISTNHRDIGSLVETRSLLECVGSRSGGRHPTNHNSKTMMLRNVFDLLFVVFSVDDMSMGVVFP